jgi:hypothetical protein
MAMVPRHIYESIGRSVFGPLGTHNPEDFKNALFGWRWEVQMSPPYLDENQKTLLARLSGQLKSVLPQIRRLSVADGQTVERYMEAADACGRGETRALIEVSALGGAVDRILAGILERHGE